MKKKENIMLGWFLALVLIGMALALYIYTVRATNDATERTKSELMDKTSEQAVTLETAINSRFVVIETVASGVTAVDKYSISSCLKQMESIVSGDNGFINMIIADKDGDGWMPDGTETYIGQNDYFEKAISGQQTIELTTEKTSNSYAAVFAIPITAESGEVIGVIAGFSDEQGLRDMLTSIGIDDGNYGYIIDSDGTIIVSSSSYQSLAYGDNVFDSMSTNGDYSDVTVEELKLKLVNNEGGTLEYTFEGEDRLGVFAPLNTEDIITGKQWYILDTVSKSVITQEASTENRNGLEQLLIVIIFGGFATFLFVYTAKMNRKRLERESNALRAENQRFSIVYENSTISVWDYDIIRNEIHQDVRSIKIHGFGPIIRNVPNSLIESGYVHHDSARAYLEMYKKLRGGEKMADGVFQIRRPDQAGYWYEHIRYYTLFNEHGRPYWAIGTAEDITERREQEMAYAKWQKEINSSTNKDSTVFGWNLSKDVLDGMERVTFKFAADMDLDSGLNALVKGYADKYVDPEDAPGLLSIVNRERLIGLYHDDIFSSKMDYRKIGDDGKYSWMGLTIQMVQYPDTGEIKAYLVSRDIDREKKQELARIARAEKDSLTDSLNREAFEDHVRKLLSESESGTCHAFIMLDIDDFKVVNDTFGHDAGDRLLEEMIKSIRALLRYNDIIGRMGGDEFMICMRDVSYDAVIEKKAQQICEVLRRKLSDDIIVSLSLGISVFPRDGSTFDQLYKAADMALYYTKQNSKDGYNFYHENMREGNRSVEKINVMEPGPSVPVPAKRMLIVDDDESDREFLSDIFSGEFTIITAKNGETALSNIKRYGSSISIVLLDLNMPSMSGFDVMANMKNNSMLIEMPVIAVTSDNSEENMLDALAAGASDILYKPVDERLAKLKVRSVMTRISNEKVRAQSSYLRLQGAEEERYRRVLSATGTVVAIHDYNNNIYSYDSEISKYIAGNFDSRPMDRILIEDEIASKEEVANMKQVEEKLIGAAEEESAGFNMKLMIPGGDKHVFRVQFIRMSGSFELTEKMLVTFNDINDAFNADAELKRRAERDPLTGLYNRETFFEKAGELLYAQRPNSYILSAFDINNFRTINDQYGQAAGDYLLKQVSEFMDEIVSKVGGFCCRISADNFACVFPGDSNSVDYVTERRAYMLTNLDMKIVVTFSVGRYVVEDLSLPVSAMYDRANMAKKSIKGRYDVHTAYYNANMRETFLREQTIISSMEQALEEKQYKVYFQPQYNHATGAMIGAEALTRWQHPTEGLISPGIFIPIFEKNGFIFKLDQYIWEETCRLIRNWIDEGISVIPISVNVSRFDIYQDDFFEVITNLMKKYRVTTEYLRLEITETAFSSSPQQIIKVVKRLVEFGFTVEIDDFGSGYSSLNTLKDVPAQILKLDMRFMENSTEKQRGGSIVNSVVRMAKWLYMPVIAEGVETIEQADFLNSIGCNYVQGFLYAKPMPVEEFEELMKSSPTESKMEALKTVRPLDPNAFWDPKSMETLIFNSYVGGAAVAEYCNGKLEYLRVNEKFIQELRSDVTVGKILSSDPFGYSSEEFRRVGKEAIEKAIATGEEVEFETMNKISGNSSPQWIKSRICVIGRSYGRTLLYIAIENITDTKLAEQKIVETGEQLSTIMDTITSGVCAYAIEDYYHGYVLFANAQYYSMLGYTEEQFKKEVKMIFDVFPEQEKHRVLRHVMEAMSTAGELISYDYHALKRDGSIVILHGDSKIISISGEVNPVLLVITTDVTDTIEKEQASELRKYTDALLGLYDDIFEFNFQENVIKRLDSAVDSRFAVADELEPRIFRLIDAFVCPDDRERVTEYYKRYANGDMSGNSELEFRLFSESRTIWYYARVLALTDYRYILMMHDETEEKQNALVAEQQKAVLSVITGEQDPFRIVAIVDMDTGEYNIVITMNNGIDLPMEGKYDEMADLACETMIQDEAERKKFRNKIDRLAVAKELNKKKDGIYRFVFEINDKNSSGSGEFVVKYLDELKNKLIFAVHFTISDDISSIDEGRGSTGE